MLPTQKPRRGLDDAQLAAIVLGSLEHFPQYRDVFHAVSVRAVAQDPRYVTLARRPRRRPTTRPRPSRPTSRAAAAMGAPQGAAALVARSLVRSRRTRELSSRPARRRWRARVDPPAERGARGAEHAGRGRRRAGRGLPAGAAAGRGGAAAGAGPTGDGPPCPTCACPRGGPPARRVPHARADEGVYRRVSQEPPAPSVTRTFRCVVEGRGALGLVGSRPARDAAGLAPGHAAAASYAVRAPRYTAHGATGRPSRAFRSRRSRRRRRPPRRRPDYRPLPFARACLSAFIFFSAAGSGGEMVLRAAWEGGIAAGPEARGPRTKLERKARASAHRARVGAAAGRRLGGRELQDRRLAVALLVRLVARAHVMGPRASSRSRCLSQPRPTWPPRRWPACTSRTQPSWNSSCAAPRALLETLAGGPRRAAHSRTSASSADTEGASSTAANSIFEDLALRDFRRRMTQSDSSPKETPCMTRCYRASRPRGL